MDNMPDLTASLDQVQMACRMMARTSWLYFQELTIAGFTRDEAYSMTVVWQDSMFQDGTHEH